MASLNKVFLIGNLVRDPDARQTPTGTPVTDMRLAVTRQYRTQDGRQQEETCFVDVTVWGRQAETVGEYLKKGSPVLVEGRLKLDEWTTKDNQKASRLSVVAERVQFLGAPRRGEYGDAPAGESAGARPAPKRAQVPQTAAPPPGEDPEKAPEGNDDENLPF
jgi:single-strand DNA-binding protein